MVGPKGSPYEGGTFYITLNVSNNYPRMPPDVRFMTRIYHPSVRKEGFDVGRLCKDIIKSIWTSNSRIVDVVQLLNAMMKDPPTDNPVESSIAKEMTSDREGWFKKARQWAVHFADAPEVLEDVKDEEDEEA
jgi:ubiquitin-protein ligase